MLGVTIGNFPKARIRIETETGETIDIYSKGSHGKRSTTLYIYAPKEYRIYREKNKDQNIEIDIKEKKFFNVKKCEWSRGKE